MAYKRIHITGASGSGTTALGRVLAERLDLVHLDTDDYFWIPTDPPYQDIRETSERQNLLSQDMLKYSKWISTGSLCGWGDFALEFFDLMIFLFVPQEIRIKRLLEREKTRCPESFIEGTLRNSQFNEFIDWAKKYDNGGMEVRSLYMHKQWLDKLNCPVLQIEGDLSVAESIKRVEEFIKAL